jgi:hypothetical protein
MSDSPYADAPHVRTRRRELSRPELIKLRGNARRVLSRANALQRRIEERCEGRDHLVGAIQSATRNLAHIAAWFTEQTK